MEFNIKLSNGQILRGLIKSPGDHIRAVVILVHGLGEHIQRYNHWAELFVREGIGFTGVDLPGHGRSDGTRGRIKSYELLYEMLDILIRECRKTFPGIPVFLYGHSMGGTIVTGYLLKKSVRIKGSIVTSPWLKLSFEPPRIKKIVAAIVKNIMPGLIQPSGLEISHLSHDPVIAAEYRDDPLVHEKISVKLYYDTMVAASYALSNASGLSVPLLLMHGTDDMICSPEGSREFASKTALAELKIWEGGYHELHNEPFKNEVFEYLMNWINIRLAK